MTILELRILGIPAPQGSKKAYVVGGRARLTEAAGAKHTTWRTDVVEQTRTQLPDGWESHERPVGVELVFYQAPPKSLPRHARAFPPDRGADIDKLARSTLDALTIAGVWDDDKRVTDLRARKRWAIDGPLPGCRIRVWEEPVT